MSSLADSGAMLNDAWRDRLRAVIKMTGKSNRSVSIAAGVGPGYVHSILEEGKSPTIDNLMKVCEAVPVSPIYVLLGVEAAPEDITILRALHDRPTARDGILTILRSQEAPRSDE